MPRPLSLELTFTPGQENSRRLQTARLASRLDYQAVWLTIPPQRDNAWAAQLKEIHGTLGTASLGIVVARESDRDALAWVARLGLVSLWEIGADVPRPAAVREIVSASGGLLRAQVTPDSRAERGPSWPDGLVVRADECASREEVLALVRIAVDCRGRAGRSPAQCPVVVALPAVIGRTQSEADARRARDPSLAGAHGPLPTGLFGTLDIAESQARDLLRAGADVLRVQVPDEHDIADPLAQTRTLARNLARSTASGD